jgi:hypothetical protein
MRFPIVVFDDEYYPYILENTASLSAWQEPGNVFDFRIGFDSDGRVLALNYNRKRPESPPSWLTGEPSMAQMRETCRTSLKKYHAGNNSDIAALQPVQLIRLLQSK